MTTMREESEQSQTVGAGCHIKVWSPECETTSTSVSEDKYLCSSCKTIPALEHEIRHEPFPYICGDEENMS